MTLGELIGFIGVLLVPSMVTALILYTGDRS